MIGAFAVAGPAYAAAPELVGLKYERTGFLAVKWTPPGDGKGILVEVASSPETQSNGRFLSHRVVRLDGQPGTSTGSRFLVGKLRPGPYFVHVATTQTDCTILNTACVTTFEWSSIKMFTVASKCKRPRAARLRPK